MRLPYVYAEAGRERKILLIDMLAANLSWQVRSASSMGALSRRWFWWQSGMRENSDGDWPCLRDAVFEALKDNETMKEPFLNINC